MTFILTLDCVQSLIRFFCLLASKPDFILDVIIEVQIPAMYAKLHFVNWVEKLEDWSFESLDSRCLVSRTYKSGLRAGETHVVCAEHMKSLEKYGSS